jgi:hypothetical protein
MSEFKVANLAPTDEVPQTYGYKTYVDVLSDYLKLPKGAHGYPVYADGHAERWEDATFSTWSLFLIANPSWLTPWSAERIEKLHECYIGFARAIGGAHAAVWFGADPSSRRHSSVAAQDVGAQIDTERCAKYSAQLGLDLARSPHVIVTTSYPAEEPLRDCIVISLNGLSVDSTLSLLTLLGTELINEKLKPFYLDAKRWWLVWKDVLSSVKAKFTDAAAGVSADVSASVTTGVLNFKVTAKKPVRSSKQGPNSAPVPKRSRRKS